MEILFEDDSLLVCVKPAGLLSQAGPVPGESVPERLALLKGGGTFFPVHRLDQAAGGLLAVAKTQRATASLSAAMQSGAFVKDYLAVLLGAPEQEAALLQDYLFRDAGKNKTFVVKRPRKGVREASLSYRLLARVQEDFQDFSCVRIRLHTGRTHQIRAQFASRRLPLWGDRKYGARAGDSLALWCCRLSFPHPVSGAPLSFCRLPPELAPWSLFSLEETALCGTF